MSKATVRLFDDADKSLLYLVRDGSTTNTVTVTPALKLYIDDAGRDLRGYGVLGSHSSVVRMAFRDEQGLPIVRKKNTPLTPAQLVQLQAELTKHVDACDLTGVPVALLSGEYYDESRFKKRRSGGGEYNPKHRATMFSYTGHSSSTASGSWETVVREPQDDDVFVVIESFKAYETFRQDYVNDERIAEMLGIELPTVYGYKTTEKKPVDAADLTGTEYREWRQTWVEGLLTDANRQLIADTHWILTFNEGYVSPEQLTKLAARIGDDHRIVQALRQTKLYAERIPTGKRDAILALGNRNGLSRDKSAAKGELNAIFMVYPLLSFEGIKQLWSGGGYYGDAVEARRRVKAWTHYVVMVDAAARAAAAVDEDDVNAVAS